MFLLQAGHLINWGPCFFLRIFFQSLIFADKFEALSRRKMFVNKQSKDCLHSNRIKDATLFRSLRSQHLHIFSVPNILISLSQNINNITKISLFTDPVLGKSYISFLFAIKSECSNILYHGDISIESEEHFFSNVEIILKSK